MKKIRTERIGAEIQKELSKIIRDDLNDPRLSDTATVSVIEVRVTNDLSFADCYISVLGDNAKKDDVLDALNQAKGYIKMLIGDRMRLRSMPEFRFKLDESIEYGAYMEKLIKETIAKDERAHEDNDNF
ncbi:MULTISPECIES: 30S ribosome-binding factor RbfA [Anaerococcus]|jgi:ribosome-binding factor A|uniref:Ribosome-binding factor A n=1 Tax=Anaerococcus octavius TaxID=54007 RepID=A0A2I1M4X3_9FIRM|nr:MULTISPECIES: 30S ribosome-binding factor RbfA [Anaerococcus]MBS6106405.1 30S ribosome-binding factor RbfA [Anaerococcus sp.]MDU0894965.1 30S ribosome-binding factor RbfA [Anaerococcus sp.]MDU2599053.1 30S ribosome-binding factor RbfA [Anaerococcus sp.]MDU3176640.1 30S ribosome-binding factor RbfA [Anaerococcus sp.]MDU4025651.1 30S ribosome-binding factor RbfA [Anaerococcus sp.]